MVLKSLSVENFKGFSSLEATFHPSFNLVVGVNGTGKSSLLEAIRIAIGSLFLEVDKVEDKIFSPGIPTELVRIHHLERQYPVDITAVAHVQADLLATDAASVSTQEIPITWSRRLEKHGGRTTKINAKEMSALSAHLQDSIRAGVPVDLPLVAYYSADRFKKEKKDVGLTAKGSRLRGYYNALDPLTNVKFFLDLFKTETLSELQHQTTSLPLRVVKQAVLQCIEDCRELYFDVAEDQLLIELGSVGEKMPFHFLPVNSTPDMQTFWLPNCPWMRRHGTPFKRYKC